MNLSLPPSRLWRGCVWTARLVLALVLLVAALPKLADPADFAAKLPNYRLFPDPLINIIAVLAPVLELLAAATLLSGRLYRGGVLLTTLLMVTFTALIGSALGRGIDLDCGCFGAIAPAAPATSLDLFRNLFLLALATFLLLDLRRSHSDNPSA